jgi:uncharacterized membrane protein
VSQKQYARDLIVMTGVTGLTVAATIAFGPYAGIAVFGVCLIVGGLVGVILAMSRDITELDERYSRIDQQLDQERRAQAAVRVQHTVQAEPQAPVVDLFSRKPIA